jgi:hypothetical protein
MYLTSLGEAFMGLDLWLHVHVSFPQSRGSAVERGVCAWSFRFVSTSTRKCRSLPEAQERGLTFVIRMHRLQPISICKTHGARGRGARSCCDCGESGALQRLALSADMVRRVGSSSVWTWVWKLYVSFCYRSVIAVTIHM